MRIRRCRLFAASLVLLALVPTAQAASQDFDEVSGHQYRVTETLRGPEAVSHRRALDAAGDADGFVTLADIRSYRQARDEAVIEDPARCLRSFTALQKNGAPPESVTATIDFEGADGRTDDGSALRRSVIFWFEFGEKKFIGENGDRFALRFSERDQLRALYACLYPDAEEPVVGQGPPAKLQISPGVTDSSDLECDIAPPAARALYAKTHTDNANIPQHSIVADTPSEVASIYEARIEYTDGREKWWLSWEPNGFNPCVAANGLIMGGLGLLTLALGSCLLLTEVGRAKALAALASLGLFSRLERDQTLAHERRDAIYELLRREPGLSFEQLRRELAFSMGGLAHHLRVLQSQGFVQRERQRFRTRFYLRPAPAERQPYLSSTEKRLLDEVAANPGLTQRELARRVGLPRQSVHYHVAKLGRLGKVRIRPQGRRRLYFPGEAAGVPT